MFAEMYGSGFDSRTTTSTKAYNYAVQGAIASDKLKEESIAYNALRAPIDPHTINGYSIDSIVYTDEYQALEESSAGYIKKRVAEKLDKAAAEEAASNALDGLVEVTRWTRVDGDDGSLLKSFPISSQKEMLAKLEAIKAGESSKYKKPYSQNIDNKIIVLKYLLKDK